LFPPKCQGLGRLRRATTWREEYCSKTRCSFKLWIRLDSIQLQSKLKKFWVNVFVNFLSIKSLSRAKTLKENKMI
jgi:hypothetical protein